MKDAVDISVLIDASGSMQELREATIGGFNKFLAEQQALPGEATATVVLFDSVMRLNPGRGPSVLATDYVTRTPLLRPLRYRTLAEAVPLDRVPPLSTETYVPEGNTPLLDAMGKLITETGARLAALPDADRPNKVVIVIMTDGEENDSSTYTKAQIDQMVQHQRDVYQWEFLYLGANQDAIAVATNLGMPQSGAANYRATPSGTRAAYMVMSASLGRSRAGGSTALTDAEREELDNS